MNILDSIINEKRREVERRRKEMPVEDLKRTGSYDRPAFSLKASLREPGPGIIAEFKRKSPSRGMINSAVTISEVTGGYYKNGAKGISVLTDEKFFGGSLKDLIDTRVHEIPLLRKDFVIDEYQLYESRAYGADVILLIAACLSRQQTSLLSKLAKALGLEVLLEIHDESEIDHITDAVDMVGINNRDLKTFTVDVARSLALAPIIPGNKILISESGINDVATVKVLENAGFRGFLIGELFMKENDPATALQEFINKYNNEN